ncbi:MAG: magnesium transporter [Rubrimonas sp.]
MAKTAEKTRILNAAALSDWIRAGDLASVAAALRGLHPADIAPALAALTPAEAAGALDVLPVPRAAETFGYLEPEVQQALAAVMDRRQLSGLVGAMSHDERADLYNALPEDVRAVLMPALAQAEREDLRRLAAYPEGSAGAIMTSDYVALPPHLTAPEAIDALRRAAPDAETIYKAYVLDESRRPVGAVALRDLILARDDQTVAALMQPDPVAVAADAPREQAVSLIAKYDLLALPVVDGAGAMVGIVTADDALDAAEEEATIDFRKHGSVAGGVLRPSRAPLWTLYRARVFWLVVLVFGNVFSGAAIASFEDMIAANVALVFFLPLLIDSGGNAGSQAATLMVRSLATGEVMLRDYARLIGRETLVAAALGLTMALAVAGVGLVRAGPEVALVVAASMVLIVLVGSIVGMSMPFLLSRFGFDPAAASAPLITSIADATGVLIYFGLASHVFGFAAI